MAEDLPKIAHHIFEGEDHITRIEALMEAALALTDHLTDAMHAASAQQNGGKPSLCAGDGLAAVLDTIDDHVGELRSWWRQLHELGVRRDGESRHG